MTDKANIIGGLIRKFPDGTFGTSELTLVDGDTVEVKRTEDLYSTRLTISTDEGNRSLLSSLTPPWYAGTNFVWPAIGRYDNDVIDMTILSGGSGSEYAVGNTELGATTTGKHKTLLHGTFTVGANKPCNIQLTFADGTTKNETVTPIILAAPTELIHDVYVVPDSWGQGASRETETDFKLGTHWSFMSVHYGGATGANQLADSAVALNANFDFATHAQGVGWVSSMIAGIHAAGRKALVVIGGEGRTASCIYKWASVEGRVNSVNELLALCDEAGFDGVSIDIEGGVANYSSYDVWMITADMCRRLREARPSIIMSGAIYTLENSNTWPDYDHWWDYNGGRVACATCMDFLEMQSYGVSTVWWAASSFTAWHGNPIRGGSGPNSYFPVTAAPAPYDNPAQYTSHPMDWTFDSLLLEKFGVPPQHICMGYQFTADLRGPGTNAALLPGVQNPGDNQNLTASDRFWQVDFDWVKTNVVDAALGTEIQDGSGVPYRHWNPPTTITGVAGFSYLSYLSPYFFTQARSFLTGRGHLGLMAYHRGWATKYGLPTAYPLLNPSNDIVSNEPTLPAITGAAVNTRAVSAPITVAGLGSGVAGHVSVRYGTSVEWRKTPSGGSASAWFTADGTVINGDVVEFGKTTSSIGGFTTQDPVILCGWPLTLEVSTAAGSNPANTWSTTDKAASIAISGSNLLATRTGGSEGSALVRALRKLPTTGKWIWSVRTTGGFGMAASTAPLTIAVASGNYYGHDADSWGYSSDGWHAWNVDSVGVPGWWGTWPSFADTDDMTVCWIPATQMLWIAKGSGDWNYDATANPATGVGGLWTPMSGDLYAMAFLFTTPNNVASLNAGRVSLPRTVAGFTPLDNAP